MSIVPENGTGCSRCWSVIYSRSREEQGGRDLAEDDDQVDNEFFYLKGTTLVPNAVFDYDEKPSMMIRVAATDTGGLKTVTDIVIFVSNENEPPISLSLVVT